MEAGRYKAFLSYSHRDAGHAAWLHRRLEGYRIPRRLAGSEGEHGPVPERLAPIFRDREELPAAGDLSEKVRGALAVSDHLIVVCSPASAASPWVAKEIAAFRELHPGRPILAAIVEGEPPACFPAGLCQGGTEPLAADLREEGDGRRLGFLKLVAGLAGVGLDALVQRDAARRVRRVTWVTAGAVAAMLVMAVMTAIALNARAEAQRQRAEAEGLVEFMLTDLRDRLRAVGRLDVMASVNQRALRYYGEHRDLQGLQQESLARRARIFHSMGDDSLDRDDTTAALAAFEEARRTTAELLLRDMRNPRRAIEHIRSLSGIGRVHEVQGNWLEARKYFFASDVAATKLVSAYPRNPDYLMKAATAAINIGNIDLQSAKNYSAAQHSYEKAVRLLVRAAWLRPGDLHILLGQANAYGWLGDTFYYRERWHEARSARLRQMRIVAALRAAHPDDADIGFWFAAASRGLAYARLRIGEDEQARAHLIVAAEIVTRLVRQDPANHDWQSLQTKLKNDLGQLETANDNTEGGLMTPTRT